MISITQILLTFIQETCCLSCKEIFRGYDVLLVKHRETCVQKEKNEEEKESKIEAAHLTDSLSVRNGGQFVKEVVKHWMGQSDMRADWEPFMAASQDKAETASEDTTDPGLEILSRRLLEEKVKVNIQHLSKCNL